MRSIREKITMQVLEVIQYVRGSSVKEPPLTLDMELVKDLHMGHDVDDVVLILQSKTGIKPSKSEWEEARTISDIIEILLKNARE